MQTIELIVSGIVQGVGFRWTTIPLAKKLGINGTIQNLADGTVRMIVQADETQIKQFIEQLPGSISSAAHIDHIDQRQLQIENRFHGFNVIY